MQSRGRNSPFGGWQFTSRVVMTIFKGNIVFERGTRLHQK
jgi:dihydroorotase-like cyclic amidohydrolase